MSWRWFVPGRAFRDRYFEDYRAVPHTNSKGQQKVEYVYTGFWCAWGTDEQSAKKHKIFCGSFAVVSLLLYLSGSLQRIPFNSLRLTSGLGILSAFFRILELWGVIALCIGKPYITELDRELISKRITFGTGLDGMLLLLSTVCGAAETMWSDAMDEKTGLVILADVLAAVLSLSVWQFHKRVGYRMFRNDNGKPGREV